MKYLNNIFSKNEFICKLSLFLCNISPMISANNFDYQNLVVKYDTKVLYSKSCNEVSTKANIDAIIQSAIDTSDETRS